MKQNRTQCINNDIHEWSRPNSFVDDGNAFDEVAFDYFHADMMKRIRNRFKRVRTTVDNQIQSRGLVTRSSAKGEDLFLDEDARTAETTDVKRLSRYHWEDIVNLQGGDNIVLFVSIKQKWMKTTKMGLVPLQASREQLQLGVAGQTFQIGSRPFYALKAKLLYNTMHHDIAHGFTTLNQFKDAYKENGGFSISFTGTELKLSFFWRDVVKQANDLYFFGPALDSSRRFSYAFGKNRKSITLLKRIYWDLGRETYGDTISSASLLIAYQSKLLAVREQQLKKEKTVDDLLTFNETNKSKLFFRVFDRTCRRMFSETIVCFRDTNQPILPLESFDTFVEHFKICFPRLWKHMCNLRDAYNQTKRSEELVRLQERQIFCQILALVRMKDCKLLKWWSMIQTIAFYGWGVGRAALGAISFWGMVCSASTRTRSIALLTKQLLDRRMKYFSKEIAIKFIMDNYEERQTNKYARGGCNSGIMSGTHQLAERVIPFNNTTWDDKSIALTYTPTQRTPSMALMPHFERLDCLSTRRFIKEYKLLLPPSISPCFTGDRNISYMKRLKTIRWTIQLQQIFGGSRTAENDRFVSTSMNINREPLLSLARLCETDSASSMFRLMKLFQHNVTRTCNPDRVHATETNYMGIVTMSEAASQECGGLTLDLLYKFGVLIKLEDGTFDLGPDWEEKRCYIIGDVKTADNIDKFIRDLVGRPLSLNHVSDLADIFEKALTRVVVLPGDWHAGLSKLQAIHNIYWDDLLAPFLLALQWKLIYKDARKNYFGARRLVQYVFEQMVTIMMELYVSKYYEELLLSFKEETDQTDDNYVCFIALSFEKWLVDLRTSNDHWLRVCSGFVFMANEFNTFVDSYRSGDAIGIDEGYHIFTSVYRVTGQHRYLERAWRQDEQLYGIPYRMTEEARRHRTSRQYSQSSNKPDLTGDEKMELANRYMEQMPKSMTTDGFGRRGDIVGIAIMAKRMTTMIMCQSSKQVVYRSGSSPKCFAEKILIYTMLDLLETSKVMTGRRMRKGIVHSVMKKAKELVSIKCSKIQERFTGKQDHSAFEFRDAVSEIMHETNNTNNDDLTLDAAQSLTNNSSAADKEMLAHDNIFNATDAVDEADLVNLVSEEVDLEERSISVDLEEIVDEKDKNSKDDTTLSKNLGYNRFLVDDIWKIGTTRLLADDIPRKRQKAEERMKRKRDTSRAITASERSSSIISTFCFKEDIDIEPMSWNLYAIEQFPDLYTFDEVIEPPSWNSIEQFPDLYTSDEA